MSKDGSSVELETRGNCEEVEFLQGTKKGFLRYMRGVGESASRVK
jgi:hypothetical protein